MTKSIIWNLNGNIFAILFPMLLEQISLASVDLNTMDWLKVPIVNAENCKKRNALGHPRGYSSMLEKNRQEMF
jgi:hypothetical protein